MTGGGGGGGGGDHQPKKHQYSNDVNTHKIIKKTPKKMYACFDTVSSIKISLESGTNNKILESPSMSKRTKR